MVFESVRGYIEVASGLTELTRARAMEAAHGLLSLPASGIATSGKVAVQAAALADELMAAAAANRSDLRALVRSEVDVAVTRLGLVPVQKLQEAQSEAARLRAEVSRLRSAVPKGPAKRSAARTSSAKKAAVRTSPAKRVATPRGEAKQAAGGPATPTKAAAGTSPAKTVPAPRSAAKQAVGGATTPKKSAVRKGAVKRVAVPRSPAKKAAAGTSAARKSAVTTRGKPAGT